MTSSLNKYQIDKLGNTLLYLSNHVGDFSKTKALKLLFLLEEKSVQRFGVPFFGFDFKVWQYGPVNEFAFDELSAEKFNLLADYIKYSDADPVMLEAARDFNDDEFSENDIFIMEEVIQLARHRTAKELVNITHSKDSLWRIAAIENEVYDLFLQKKLTKTEIVIDFSKLLEQDLFLKERYENSLEYIKFNTLINK
jgi:uncharacterized phage-associated protein